MFLMAYGMTIPQLHQFFQLSPYKWHKAELQTQSGISEQIMNANGPFVYPARRCNWWGDIALELSVRPT